MNDKDLDDIAINIDYANDVFDEKKIFSEINKCKKYLNQVIDSTLKARLYYLLANAWASLHLIEQKADKTETWNYEQEKINKQIIYLRKAKQEEGFKNLKIEYQCSILVNLANIFSHTGRTIYAISLCNQALEINSNFFMARVNRAICFRWYSYLDYDVGHKEFFTKSVYDDFKKAFNIMNLSKLDEYHYNIYEDCKNNIKYLEDNIPREFLNSKLDLDSFSFGETDEEQKFRKWSIYNGLFLNPMNDIGFHNIASHDPLGLPNIVRESKVELMRYVTYFNQLKQEYISFRHLLYEGVHRKTDEFYDKDTVIIDDLKLLNNDINTEKVKLAFRGFYSIFDKIAYFINEYFELNHNPNNIYFSNVWKEKDNKQKFNVKFNEFENLALRGLYFISKDLFFSKDKKSTEKHNENKEYLDILEPEAQKINDIRNHLEHKFVNIRMFDIETKYDDKRELNISISDLENKTLYLAKLARESLIYLSFAIHIEEKTKEKIDGVFPMILNEKG